MPLFVFSFSLLLVTFSRVKGPCLKQPFSQFCAL